MNETELALLLCLGAVLFLGVFASLIILTATNTEPPPTEPKRERLRK